MRFDVGIKLIPSRCPISLTEENKVDHAWQVARG